MSFIQRMSFFLFFSATLIASTEAFDIVPIHDYELFVPRGFDSNDTTEVIVYGYLPNTCYLDPTAQAKVLHNSHIAISMNAKFYRNASCTAMVVPFLISAKIGQIAAGTYSISVNVDEINAMAQPMASIIIEKANSNSIDNHIYANVSSIEVDEENKLIHLKGQNPSPCMELKGIKTIYNGSNVLAVLPIMEKKDDICVFQLTSFHYELPMSVLPKVQTILLHVRRMDGTSFNHLYQRHF